jgi:hypothetical protein
MKNSNIHWTKILEQQIPNVKIDFENKPIHYSKVMELAKLGYKVPQSLIDYRDNDIIEDADNQFFSDEFVQHIKDDLLVEITLNLPKKYVEFAKKQKLDLSKMINMLIAKKMQIDM